MPSIMYHSTFAWIVYQKCRNILQIDRIKFIEGNLIPDLSVESKEKTHFQIASSVDGFKVPDLSAARKVLFGTSLIDGIKNSLIFGMYCHLYLDYHFITKFLIPEFEYNTTSGVVRNPRNNKIWTVDEFFSNNGMYGSYTEINQLLIRDGFVPSWLLTEVPDNLSITGIELYDNRSDKTWKAELIEYMNEKREYTGDIFDYKRLCNCIEDIAIQFVDEIRATISYANKYNSLCSACHLG